MSPPPPILRMLLGLLLIAAGASCRTDPVAARIPAGPRLTVRDDGWRVVGPGGGGAMFCPAVSPHDSNFVLLASDMTGAYVSRDDGQSWRMFNLQQIARQLVFDPLKTDVVYARTDSLYRSSDRGVTWHLIYPTPAEVSGYASMGDHAERIVVTTDRIRRKVTAFAIDPQTPETLYAAVEIAGTTFLLTSRDGGRQWQATAAPVSKILDLFVDPRSGPADRTLLAAHEQGIAVRQHGQWHDQPIPGSAAPFTRYAAGFDAAHGRFLVYAVSTPAPGLPLDRRAGVFVTADDGATWTDLSPKVLANHPSTTSPVWRSIATCATDPGTIYLSYRGITGPDGEATLGVACSADHGATWNLSWQDPINAKPAGSPPLAIDGWLDEAFGPDWGENPFAFGVDPRNPQHCFATDFGRTVKTTDGGRTWRQVYTRTKPAHGWVSRGLDVTNANSIVFDPFDLSRAFLTVTDIGLMQSNDGGESWFSASNAPGIPRQWINTPYCLIPDPHVRGRMWISLSSVHDLPREKMWHHHPTSSFDGGILQTDDGGKTWHGCNIGIGEAAITHLLVDTASVPTHRTLYATAFGHGVLKSTDGGRNWSLKNAGIAGREPLAWRIYQRHRDRALFLVVMRRSDGPIGDPETDGALYRSDDGAETWHRLPLPAGTNDPTSLAVDSVNAGTLLLSAWGRRSPQPLTSDFGGGIFLSTDEGQSWTARLTTDPHIYEITHDPRNRTFYACGFNGAAYRSLDDGVTWSRILGYDFKWGKRVDPDPRDPDMVFISTYGGGVWHGPVRKDR